MDSELDKLIKRVKTNGITKTIPSKTTRRIPKKSDLKVYNNRRLNESIIVDYKKLKELLNTDIL